MTLLLDRLELMAMAKVSQGPCCRRRIFTKADICSLAPGWKAIDKIPGDEVCTFALSNLDADVRPLPNVLHFCHRYGVGEQDFFAKKKLPTDFVSIFDYACR